MNYTWKIEQPTLSEQSLCVQLENDLKISHLMAWLLVERGITTAKQARAYIRPAEQPLNDPFLMKDMDIAVERLQAAINHNEKLLIYGDYDVDGVTAVALMVHFLKFLNANFITCIPDRHNEGYGLSKMRVDYAKENQCTLIITLDCGIRDIDSIQYALDNGIETIVCDHHNMGDTLPPAKAILNMKQSQCNYPYKDLSGCGVGFKFVHAYCKKNNINFDLIRPLMQLVALSIACDLVSMNGENRIMEVVGIKEMQERPILGIKSLLQISQVDVTNITTDDIGFRLGPRINASGRLYSADDALNLLITDKPDEAMKLAQKLNKYNEERQNEENRIANEALDMMKTMPNVDELHSTVVFSPHWHQGVVGITASILTNHYYRPTVVLTENQNGDITGSARSVGTVDIYKAIEANKNLFIKYGGHSFAAGITLPKANLTAFIEGFENYLASHTTKQDLMPILHVDAEINLGEIDKKLYQVISCLAPFGTNNTQPVFITRNVKDDGSSKRVGKAGEHLKLGLSDDTGHRINAIAFGKGDWIEYIKSQNPFSICYKIDKNTFNGITTLQLVIIDIQKDIDDSNFE